MAKSSKIRVMLSSRCNDAFPNGATTTLSSIRIDLKKEIEEMQVAGKKAFEVWINEDTSPQSAAVDSWNVCMQAVKDCDVLIVLSNGNAGWATAGGSVGICHAEMMTGLSLSPGKVRLIDLGKVPLTNDAQGQRNERFQKEVDRQSLFRGGNVSTVAALNARVKEALHDAVIALTQAGVRDASKGTGHSGAALEWSLLDYEDRSDAMKVVVRNALLGQPGTKEDAGNLLLKMAKKDVLVVLHALPAAFTIGAAREKVGQPFLRDYQRAAALKAKRGGPFHLIACQKTISESQAINLLGFPDAVHVDAPFGRYVADRTQKIQFAFLTKCRDETSTRHGVQRFMEWLEQTGEIDRLTGRALARARIVQAIAKENQ